MKFMNPCYISLIIVSLSSQLCLHHNDVMNTTVTSEADKEESNTYVKSKFFEITTFLG